MKHVAKTCSVGKVGALIGDQCSLLIVRDLLENPKRFGELEASLHGSTRTLTKKLKLLEKEKLITKMESADSPACVKYVLTRKGIALGPTIEAMRAYGANYLR